MNRFGSSPSKKSFTAAACGLFAERRRWALQLFCYFSCWELPCPRPLLSKERLSARYLIPPVPWFRMPRSRLQASRLVSLIYVTNNDGNYTASGLSVGHYNMLVDVAGFKRVEQNNIVLDVAARDRYDFRLQVGRPRIKSP